MIEIKINDIFESRIYYSRNGKASAIIQDNCVIVFNKNNTLNSLNEDLVKLEVIGIDNDKIEGRVVEVLERNRTEFVGVVELSKNKNIFIKPCDVKIHTDFYVINKDVNVYNNQKVLVRLVEWLDTKSPQVEIINIIGEQGDNDAEMNSIMMEFNLPIEFKDDILKESENIGENISKSDLVGRFDFRDWSTFTIDPKSAKDFDDALSIKLCDSFIEVAVHVADVSHYVKAGSLIDKEAYNRGTSVYLVDRCIPMLPERLSNNICSLVPNKDRLTFSIIFKFNHNLDLINEIVTKGIICSDEQFSYEEAQAIIDGESSIYQKEVILLNDIAKNLRKHRMDNGSIEINSTEVSFKLDDKGKPIDIIVNELKDSNRLIEEFMLLANKTVSKLLSDNKYVSIYRIHNTPCMDKLMELRDICSTFGHEFNIINDQCEIKSSINKLINDIKGSNEDNMINSLIVRSMSKATYTTVNIGHYGLGFKYYSHFTSPIRRYPDLILHRILSDFIRNNGSKNPALIEEQSKWCSKKELAANKAQRESIKYKQAEYLLDKVGNSYNAIVTGVSDWCIYTELTESKCEGIIRLSGLVNKWSIGSNKYIVTDGFNEIKIGDELMVIVKSVNLNSRQVELSIMI